MFVVGMGKARGVAENFFNVGHCFIVIGAGRWITIVSIWPRRISALWIPYSTSSCPWIGLREELRYCVRRRLWNNAGVWPCLSGKSHQGREVCGSSPRLAGCLSAPSAASWPLYPTYCVAQPSSPPRGANSNASRVSSDVPLQAEHYLGRSTQRWPPTP
jgi:hypothetical protein